MRTLREHSAVSLDDVAAKVEIPLCAVHWLVEGQVVAPWSTTYTLVHLLGGQPEDLYLLWRSATKPAPGVLNSPCLDGLLAAGLRGARLAAGQPTAASACPPGLTEAEVEAVFAGRLVPEWSVLCELLLRLDADPDPFEELWTAHQAARRRRSR